MNGHDPSMPIVATTIRIAVGVMFTLAGLMKFTMHATEARNFRHWHLPLPGTATYGVGALELVCGLALLAGVLTGIAALLLAGDMVGAMLTAGIVDGGFHLLAPPLLLAGCVVVILGGGGRLQLAPRHDWSPRRLVLRTNPHD